MDMSNIALRLEQRFSLGTRPELRRALYLRLEKLVNEEGVEAYQIIASVAADAVGKNHPGRYFSRVVCLRLTERGILQPAEL